MPKTRWQESSEQLDYDFSRYSPETPCPNLAREASTHWVLPLNSDGTLIVYAIGLFILLAMDA
jgi:hypothetical protein